MNQFIGLNHKSGLISDLEAALGGESFNVKGIPRHLPANTGQYKHVTVERYGTSQNPTDYVLLISGMLAWSDEKGTIAHKEDYNGQATQIISNIANVIIASADYLIGPEHKLTKEEALKYITYTKIKLLKMGDNMANMKGVNKAYADSHLPVATRDVSASSGLPLKEIGAVIMIEARAHFPHELVEMRKKIFMP